MDPTAYSFSVTLHDGISVTGWMRVFGIPMIPLFDSFPPGVYEFELVTTSGTIDGDHTARASKLRWRFASRPPDGYGGRPGSYRFLGSTQEEQPRLSDPEYWSRIVTEMRDRPAALIRTLARFD